MKLRKHLLSFCLLVGLSGWAMPASAAGDIVYISDSLRVGVRPEPDTRSTPVGVVETGMKLEVLGRSNGYVQIRTEKGLTGWIKEIYASETPPAMVRLQQIEEQRAGTLARLKELQDNTEVLEAANSQLNEQLDQVRAERTQLQLRLARSTTDKKSHGNSWIIWLAGLIAVGAGAFAGGMFWQRMQTTRRFGGMRL